MPAEMYGKHTPTEPELRSLFYVQQLNTMNR